MTVKYKKMLTKNTWIIYKKSIFVLTYEIKNQHQNFNLNLMAIKNGNLKPKLNVLKMGERTTNAKKKIIKIA